MAGLVAPGFLYWDGFKYITDPVSEIVGPTGPTGPPGPGGGGGGGGNVLTYQPGGTPTGTIYASWTSLMTARSSIQGPAIIVIDDSVTSPAVIDTGTWNLNKNTGIVGYKGPCIMDWSVEPPPPVAGGVPYLPWFQIPDGATLNDPCYFANLLVNCATNSNYGIQSNVFPTLDINFYDCWVIATGDNNFILSPGGIINLYGYTLIDGFNGNDYIIDGGHTPAVADYTINLYDASQVTRYSLTDKQGGG